MLFKMLTTILSTRLSYSIHCSTKHRKNPKKKIFKAPEKRALEFEIFFTIVFLIPYTGS